MELRNLRTFLEIARLGQFSKAAARMGCAQSTVTAQIKQLEGELGHELFNRMGQYVELTSYGREIMPMAEEVVGIADKISNLENAQGEISGTLRIGIIESLLNSNFLKLIARYSKVYPGVEIEMLAESTPKLQDMLLKNSLDVFVGLAQNFDYARVSTPISRMCDIIFVVGSQNPLAKKTSVSLQRLANETFVITENDSAYHSMMLGIFDRENLTIAKQMTIQSTFAIKELITQINAVSFLPSYSVQAELDSGKLVKVPINLSEAQIRLVAATRKENWHSPQLEAFLHMMEHGYMM